MLFLQIYKKGVLFFVETMNYSGENKTIDNYKSWMYHLICDKHFLANIDLVKYNTNGDFIRMYNHYFHTTIKIKKIYHTLKKKFLTYKPQ